MGEEGNPKSCDRSERKQRKKKENFLVEITGKTDEEDEASRVENNLKSNVAEIGEADVIGKEKELNLMEEGKQEELNLKKRRSQSIVKSKKKQRLLEEAAKADRCGICYLSRIPAHMDPVKLRQILSQYGEIQRIYLAPEGLVVISILILNPEYFVNEKIVSEMVGFKIKDFQKGGKKRSSFYYNLWNIKYLSKFKWDDLTAEIAYKNAVREQRLALELSAAKRERDFYLSKVEKSRALSSIEERLKKSCLLGDDDGLLANK
ncbi:activator of basal transcription 1 [Citrus sinensis]|nr:activator of basal transcription 1 [Citrus sinensis]